MLPLLVGEWPVRLRMKKPAPLVVILGFCNSTPRAVVL